MQCPRCQHENRPQAKFCEECAIPLARTCSNCSTSLSPTAKFCPECAHPVAAATAEPRFASPESYTPRHLAEKILTSKAALEGERKQVTVLFADLKGSMELLADRDPEEARKLLDPVLEHMMEAVHRYEGTVNQVMGDGIMALFGAPLAHEDHAVRACYAALRMQEAVAQYAAEVQQRHGISLHIRVGLNSGEVVVRAIGSDLHMDYTAVGQTTHLAARMEQMAAPGTILLAPATLRLAEDCVQVKSRGPVTVKGLPEPVEIHVLTGASARTRLQAGIARGLTRFVGREPEIEQIRRALGLARDGHGQLVAVVGEPGVGKSRLFHEFTRSVDGDQGWLILEAASVSYGKATSYLPVINLIKAYCLIEAQDDVRQIQEKVTGKLLALDRALEPTLPAFLALLDMPVEDAQWQALDPPQRRQRTLDACKRLFLQESQVQPLLLVFEDLHWIDSETQALLDRLVSGLASARLLLLVNYRPEYQHGWTNKTYYSQIRLDAFPAKQAGELLDSLLGSDPTLGPLKQLLVKRGNPFFVEETVRTLVETKALAGDRGSYQLTRPVREIRVPDTVQLVLAARIDRLVPEDKHLLQVAAVVGKDVPFSLLREIADLPQPMIHAGLERLQEAEFLLQTHFFPDLEYSFKHAVTHEVAYRTQLQDRRLALHGQVMAAIERLHADRLTECVEELAYHAFRGGEWTAAVRYLHQAGNRAVNRAASGAAARLFEQALDALQHLPVTPQLAKESIDIRLALEGTLFAQGEMEQGISQLWAAESSARALQDDARLGRVQGALAFMLLSNGDLDRALAMGADALTLAQRLADPNLDAMARCRMGQIRHARGEYRQALDILRQSIDLASSLPLLDHGHGSAGVSVLAHSWFAFCSADLGTFAEGRVHAEEAIKIATRTESPWSKATALTCAGYLHLRQGSFATAIRTLEPALLLCQNLDLHALSVPSGGALATAYASTARLADSREILEQTRALALSLKISGWHPLWLMLLAEAFAVGHWNDDAIELAKTVRDIAGGQGAEGYKAYALQTLGDATKATDDSAACYQAAMRIGDRLGMRPLIAHCHLGLGKLYRRTGREPEAQQHFTTATAMYREMGMTYWLERAERQ